MKDLIIQIATQGVIEILTAAIQVLFGILTVVVIKFMIHKFGLNTTNTVVQSIEQQMGGGNGAEKKAMALEVLQKSFLGKFMSADQISHLIESAVFEMNQAKDQALSQPAAAIPATGITTGSTPGSSQPAVTQGTVKGDGLDG